MNLPTRYWQPARLRRRGQRWIILKRIGLASLLLSGSSLTARHTRADDVQWTLSGDGYWDVAANWSNDQVPTSADDAMNMTGFLISLANTGYANSFTTNSDFNLTGTLNLTSKLTQSGNSVFTINGGHLAFNGSSSQVVSGNILLTSGYVGGVEGTTLTLDSSTLVHGNGFVGSYNGNPYGGSLVNNGTISADANGQVLYVQPGYNPNTGLYGNLTSTGTLQALNGGQLYVNAYGSTSGNVSTLGSNIKADGSGSTVILYGAGIFNDAATITASNSGLVYLGGDYDNQGHTITIADGSLSMAGGILRNSTVNLSGTGVGLDFSNGNGTLDNVTVNGAINVAGNAAYIYNNLTTTGGISIAGGHLQFETDSLLKSPNVALSNGYVGGLEVTTLTLDSSTVVHGYGYVGTYNSNYGGSLVNNGTLSADTNGQYLYVQPGYNPNTGIYGALTNNGTLQAINGGLLYVNPNGGGTVGGSVTAANPGSTVYLYGTANLAEGTSFKASDSGLVYLGGDYDNQGHSITIADGSLSFNGGTLRNSTVNLSGTGVGLDFSTGNGTLDNVTVNGALNVASNYAYIYNNLTATGGVTLDGGHLLFETDSTLHGFNVTNNGGFVSGIEGTTLTLDSSTVVHGYGYVGTYNGSYGGTLVNNGTIAADTSGQGSYVQPGYDPSTGVYGTLTSTGTLQATNGGYLYVSPNGNSGNTIGGNIKADGPSSSLYLYGQGTLNDATTFAVSNSGLVYLRGDYDNQNHSITIADGSLSMYGGTLRNSTVNLTGGGVGLDFSTGNGTLDNVTVNGALNVASNYAYIYNNLTATDGVTLDGGHLLFETDSTLHGFNVTNNGGFVSGIEGTTLTLDSSTVVHGYGYVGTYNGSYGGTLVNNGTIAADVSGQALYAQPGYTPNTGVYNPLVNTGTLQALNGGTLYVTVNGNSGNTLGGSLTADGANSVIDLRGSGTLSDATTFKASNGGLIYYRGDYDNQNHTLTIADGSLSFANGALRNSTVNLTGGGVGLDFSNGSGTLDNVTVNGALNIANNTAFIYNNLTATDGVTLNGGHLQFQTDSILHGFNVTNNGGYISGVEGTTLTLDSSTLVHGYGYVGTYNGSYGGTLVNNGTLSADVSGQALYAQPGYTPNTGVYNPLVNTGTLQALNGGTLYVTVNGNSGNTLGGNLTADGANSVIDLRGSGTLSDATTFKASNGGLIYYRGDYDNQGHSITIADGSLSMAGGTLHNSTVNLSGTGVGLDFSNGNGTLDNVTVNGALNVANGAAYVLNNLTATGGVTLSGGGQLQFQTDSILHGFNVTNNGGYIGGVEGTTLTLDSSTLIQGGSSGFVGAYSGNTYGGSLVNNGTISADGSGQVLFVQPGYNPNTNTYSAVTNTGTLQATHGATLYVNNYGGSGTSSGTIKADPNSTVSLNNVTQTAGQTIANGTIVTTNTFALKGGSFIGDGAVSGPLNNTGATVSPGTLTTPGYLTVNGDYSQDASSQLLIKLGGTIQGTNFDLLSVAHTATLHGALDVQLVNNFAPTVGETFDFFTYQTRIGDFDSFVSLNNGFAYNVTYNDISGVGTIHVEAVPETGTVVSLSILLLGAGCVVRRQRRQA